MLMKSSGSMESSMMEVSRSESHQDRLTFVIRKG
jgi:hypothetical protein